MAKKKKKDQRPAADPPLPPEERRAEAATVAWMLCALFTFCAEIVGLIAQAYLASVDTLDDSLASVALIPYITLVIGLVSGVICLLLTPVVYRLRKSPPPDVITVVVVLISLAPPMTLLLRWLRS